MAAPNPVDYVQGLRQWLTLLQRLPADTKKSIIDILTEAVEPIVSSARGKAPRSSRANKKGPHLQDAIGVVLRSARGILVGSRVGYGAILHFGRHSSQRSRSGNVYTRALNPVAWLYPAMAENQSEVAQRLEPAIEHAIQMSLRAVGF